MRLKKTFYSFFIGFITSSAFCNLPEKPIVAVITSYNNAPWVKKNLDSVLDQEYNNFRIIYVDDCSSDGTGDIVEQYIQEHNLEHKVNLIRNERREKKLFNIYNAYHSIDDWDIIIQIDGDDWLAHKQVFNTINTVYSESDTWLTYGQFKNSNGQPGYATDVPQHIISANRFRQWKWVYMPLRTFYAWLFKQVKVQDLLINNIPGHIGKFFPLANDCAMMYPMIEMAKNHFKFISEVLYIRNKANPISGFQINAKLKIQWVKDIIIKNRYPTLNKPIASKQKELNDTTADCIIIAHNIAHTDILLTSLAYHVSHIENVYVICQTTEKDKNAFAELKNKFFTVTFIDLAEIANMQERNKVIKALFSSLGEYILLGKDSFVFNDQVNCNQCIKDLEQTFAYGIYLNLHLTNGPFTENNERSKVPCQHIKNDLYAWKFRNSSTQKKFFQQITMSLHHKKNILERIGNSLINSIDNLIKNWENKAIFEESIGLFFQEPKLIKQAEY